MLPKNGLFFLATFYFAILQTAIIPAETSPGEKRAFQLVRQLGDEDYVERTRAMDMLKAMGLDAKNALKEGLSDPDPEIEWRCRELLPAVMEIDLRNRVALFLADKEAKAEPDLPMYNLYSKVVGNDRAARQFYASLLDQEILQFLVECAENPKQQAAIMDRYCHNLQLQMTNQPGAIRTGSPISPAQLAVALLVGADNNGQEQTAITVLNLIYQHQIRSSLIEGPQVEVFKKLLLRWMNGQKSEPVVASICNSIQNLNLKESADFITKVIKEKKVRSIYLAQIAISMARQGKKEDIKILETLLDDKTLLGRVQFNQIRGTTEIRDVALAMIVQLSGLAHKDYGFCFLTANPALIWSPHYAGFADDEKREAAHKKWQEQRKTLEFVK